MNEKVRFIPEAVTRTRWCQDAAFDFRFFTGRRPRAYER